MSRLGRCGRTIHLCGQVGAGAVVVARTEECAVRVEAPIGEAASSKGHILEAVIRHAHIGVLDAMTADRDARIPGGHAPTRACGKARLAGCGLSD